VLQALGKAIDSGSDVKVCLCVYLNPHRLRLEWI
jgi:hypothetical protein